MMRRDYLLRSGIVKPRESFGFRDGVARRPGRIPATDAASAPAADAPAAPAPATPRPAPRLGARPTVRAPRLSPTGPIPGPAPAKPMPVAPRPEVAPPLGTAPTSAAAAKPMPKPRAPQEDPSSRRRSRRKPSAIPCLITFTGLRLQLPARILDMSVGGACLQLPQAAKKAYDGDVDSLPERLTLHIKSDHMAYEGRIAWRSNDRIGIQFTSPPRFTR